MPCIATRMLQLLAVALATGLTRADFSLEVTGPDDANFKDAFGTANFPEFDEILSVTSPLPNLLLADEQATPKNSLAFRGSLPGCGVPLTVIGRTPTGKIIKYNGKITVKQAGPADFTNSVGYNGPDDVTLKKILEDVKNAGYNPTLVSKASSPSTGSEIVISLRDGSGNVIPRSAAEKIIRKHLPTGVTKMQHDCFPTCKTYCTSVLVRDFSKSFIKPGSVKDQNAKEFVGTHTKWEVRCGKDAFKDSTRACSTATCGPVGKCKTNFDDTSYGVCESCTPSTLKNEDRGPNCEVLTRSYQGTKDYKIVTRHHVADDITRPESLTLSFKFAGKCQEDDNTLCTVLQVAVESDILAEVKVGRVSEPLYTTATLPSMPVNSAKTVLRSDRIVQQGLWTDVTMVATLTGTNLKTVTVFCTVEPIPQCVERTSESSLSKKLKLLNTVVNLGGSFDGCFRSVRLNGRIVNLKADGHSGHISKTSETCSQQDASCGTSGSYLCGDKSVCYGFLGAARQDLCKCGCIGNTRMTVEKILEPGRCAASCGNPMPIMSTAASGSVSWALKGGDPIALYSPAQFSLTFRFRTTSATAPQMLQIEGSGSGASKFVLKLELETLKFCADAACHDFVPKVVSDGYWHEVDVRIAKSQLIARIDDHEQVHVLAPSEITVKSFKASMNLPSSCVSGVRIVGVYMPTSDTDQTTDSSMEVAATLNAVTVGSACNDPSPKCSCNAATETCDGVWGPKKCTCRQGFTRSGGGSCAAPSDDPCVRLKIKCPNAGGKCVQVGGKWQICQ